VGFKNPLNRLLVVKTSREYMAFELPVVSFDLCGTRHRRLSIIDLSDTLLARASFSIQGSGKIPHRRGEAALRLAVARDQPWAEGFLQRLPPRAGAQRLAGEVNDVPVRGDLAGSEMVRAEAQRRLIQHERVGRGGRAKRIRQLLTLELCYRDMRSMGVAA
jgi:hypothetical protein